MTKCADKRRDTIDNLISQYSHNQPLSANLRKKLCQELNKRNTTGNSLLLECVAQRDLKSVEILIDCPLVDVNLQDDESGYTALHKALYNGDLQLALMIVDKRKDANLSLIDGEGNTCLDLLMSSFSGQIQSHLSREDSAFEDSKDAQPRVDRSLDSCSVWTWGNNNNYVLGHVDGNDKVYAELVSVPPAVSPSTTVNSKTLRDHDPQIASVKMGKYHTAIITQSNALYMHGFGHGGRLGTGSDRTCMIPTLIPNLKVTDVALGYHHTVALLSSRTVYTWGRNNHGQLGYVDDEGTRDDFCQLEPREVGGVLKRVDIAGVTASKYHTAVFSTSGNVYTWGRDEGQLGYSVDEKSKVQVYPRKVTNFPKQDLRQISSTNSSTAVLTASNEVYVFSEGKYVRVHFQFSGFDKNIFVYRTVQHRFISKIVSGNHQYAALTNTGDVFLWTPPEREKYKDSWQQTYFPQKQPRLVWSGRKDVLSAKDVAIGLESHLLVSTADGQVYFGTRRKQVKEKLFSKNQDMRKKVYFKYIKLPYLKKVTNVAAGFSGGYSATVMCERPEDPEPLPSRLMSDIGKLVEPVLSGTGSLKRRRDCMIVAGEKSFSIHVAHLAVLSPILASLLSERKQMTERIVEDETRKIVIQSEYDESKGANIRLEFQGISEEIVRSFIEYLYTGSVGRQLIFSLDYNTRKDLNAIFALLGINVNQYEQPATFILNNFKKLLTSQDLSFSTDVVIQLKDGEALTAHHNILASRSDFFKVLFGDDTQWSCPVQDGKHVVQLHHVSIGTFRILLSWIYTSKQDLFKKTECKNIPAFIDFVMEVMRVSEEFLMNEIKELCARTLIKVVTLQNVVGFLGVAKEYRLKTLRDSCLEFACSNLAFLFENGYLQGLDAEIIAELESLLQKKQSAKFPYTRGENNFFERIHQEALVIEQEIEQELAFFAESRAQVRKKGKKYPSKKEKTDLAPKSPVVMPAIVVDVPVDDTAIFDIEMESAVGPTTPATKNKKKWTKFTGEVESPKQWNNVPTPSQIQTTPKQSLREIMLKQQTSTSMSGKSPKSPSYGSPTTLIKSPTPASSLSSQFGNLRIKTNSSLSQKERRKAANSPTPDTAPKCPWASGSTPSPIKSLAEIQKEENLFSRENVQTKKGTSGLSSSLSGSVWNRPVVQAKPVTSPVMSFERIQQEQLARNLAPKKSLKQIQQEERDIAALESFCRQLRVPGSGECMTDGRYECSLHGVLPDPQLERFLQRMIGLTNCLEFQGENFLRHEIVYKPAAETPFGLARNDDILLRIRSEVFKDSQFVKLKYRDWTLFHYGPPELPRNPQMTVNFRPLYHVAVEGDTFVFLGMLGYKFNHEFVRRGFEFSYQDIKIYIYRVHKLKETNKVTSMEECIDDWIVEMRQSEVPKGQVQATSARLFELASYVKGLVDMQVLDHTSFQNKIQYKNT